MIHCFSINIGTQLRKFLKETGKRKHLEYKITPVSIGHDQILFIRPSKLQDNQVTSIFNCINFDIIKQKNSVIELVEKLNHCKCIEMKDGEDVIVQSSAKELGTRTLDTGSLLLFI